MQLLDGHALFRLAHATRSGRPHPDTQKTYKRRMKKQYLSAFALALFASTAFAQTNPVRTVAEVAVPTENTTGKDVFIVLGNNLAARINTNGGRITGQAAGSPVRIVTVNATDHVYKIYDVKSGKWFANKGGATAPKANDQVTLSDTPSEWYIYNNNNGSDATLLDIAPKVGSASIADGSIASWNFFGGYAVGKAVGYWDANDGNSAWRLYDPKALVKSSVEALAAVDPSAATAANNAIDAASDEAGYAAALKTFRQALDGHKVRFANTGRGAKNYLTLSPTFVATGDAAATPGAEDVFVLNYHADNDNFSLEHAVTGRNLADVPGLNQAVPSTTSDATRYDLQSNDKNNTISLRNVSNNAAQNYLHLAGFKSGDQLAVVRWDAGSGDANNASTWTIENADDVTDEDIFEAAGERFMALNLINETYGYSLGQRFVSEETKAILQKFKKAQADLDDVQDLLSAYADKTSFTLNMPAAGDFFRIKSNDGSRYVTAKNAGEGAWRLQTTTDATDEGTIFGYDGSHLVSLSTGRAVYLSGGSQAKLADYRETNFGTVEFGTTPDNKYAVFVKQGGQTATMHLWQDANKTGVDGSGGKNTGHVLTHLQLEEVESVPVHLNTFGLATFAPADDMVVPDGVEIYVASQYDTAHQRINLTQLEGKVIPADTPVLLYGPVSTTIQLTYAGENDTAPTVSVNAFQGRFVPSAVPAGQEGRVLTGGEFIKVDPPFVRGMRAFVSAAPSAGTRTALAFPGVTAVESVKTASEAEAPIYDLSGRRVTKPVAGQIYVQNGKKFLQR